jgi:hypothetical protein
MSFIVHVQQIRLPVPVVGVSQTNTIVTVMTIVEIKRMRKTARISTIVITVTMVFVWDTPTTGTGNLICCT